MHSTRAYFGDVLYACLVNFYNNKYELAKFENSTLAFRLWNMVLIAYTYPNPMLFLLTLLVKWFPVITDGYYSEHDKEPDRKL